MLIDQVVEQTRKKKNPCIVGLDPEWSKIPDCYKRESLSQPEAVLNWAVDIIDHVGAVVGATFPEEAAQLRSIMKHNYFLVPGFGAQGGSAGDIVSCFHPDGLGAFVSSSRGILYQYLEEPDYNNSRKMYLEIVRRQAVSMQQEVYGALKRKYRNMVY